MSIESEVLERVARVEALQESQMRNVTSWRESEVAARAQYFKELHEIKDKQEELSKQLNGMRGFTSGVFAAAGVVWAGIIAIFTFWKKWGI